MSTGDGIATASLVVSVLVLFSVVLDRTDRTRYSEFLVRIHDEAAATQVRVRDRYWTTAYGVTVPLEDRDLAFRALAGGILTLENGTWLCRPARFGETGDDLGP